MRKLAAIACLLCVLPVSGQADVWVPPKGTWYTALSLTESRWDQFLMEGTASVNLPGEVTQYEFTLYAEHVPLDRLSIDLKFPVVISEKKFVYLDTDVFGNIAGVTTGPNGEIRDVNSNKGLGDVTLGAKYTFFDAGYISLGARAQVKFPGTYRATETVFVPTYSGTAQIRRGVVNSPGQGQTDFGVGFLAGSYLPQIRSYLRASAMFVARLGEPANQFEIMVEPGVHILRDLTARFVFTHINQLGGDDILFYDPNTIYAGNEEDANRIGLGLSYRASALFSIFALYQQTVFGRNTANTKAFTLGAGLSF